MRCRLCDSDRLRSVLDLGATPPCELFLTEQGLDAPETNYPLHLRICEDCLLLQIPALISPQDTFTDYATTRPTRIHGSSTHADSSTLRWRDSASTSAR